jgi:peptide/nickel transport system ATP-binding protein
MIMLDIKNLSICFSSYGLGLKKRTVQAIRSLDLSVYKKEVLAVVGQSGAGKSLLAHALLGILPRNASLSGDLTFKGKKLTPKDMALLRGREIALIPQSMTYLNPLLKVGVQIARAAELSGVSSKDSWKATLEALRRYRLEEKIARQFPFQLSGGIARRILTATATIGGADLILADEPTNGLDKTTAGETLGRLRELADAGKAVLLITHDIEAALSIADRVTVFCGGVTVEDARASDFNGSGKLRHPYSRALWDALPARGFVESLPKRTAYSAMDGCPFIFSCEKSTALCETSLPGIKNLNQGRVRCHHA